MSKYQSLYIYGPAKISVMCKTSKKAELVSNYTIRESEELFLDASDFNENSITLVTFEDVGEQEFIVKDGCWSEML